MRVPSLNCCRSVHSEPATEAGGFQINPNQAIGSKSLNWWRSMTVEYSASYTYHHQKSKRKKNWRVRDRVPRGELKTVPLKAASPRGLWRAGEQPRSAKQHTYQRHSVTGVGHHGGNQVQEHGEGEQNRHACNKTRCRWRRSGVSGGPSQAGRETARRGGAGAGVRRGWGGAGERAGESVSVCVSVEVQLWMTLTSRVLTTQHRADGMRACLPIRGTASEVSGIISVVMFRKNVRESRMVTSVGESEMVTSHSGREIERGDRLTMQRLTALRVESTGSQSFIYTRLQALPAGLRPWLCIFRLPTTQNHEARFEGLINFMMMCDTGIWARWSASCPWLTANHLQN